MVDKVSGDMNIEVWDELESELAKQLKKRVWDHASVEWIV